MHLKEIISFVFIDVATIIAAARLMGRLFRRFRQPAVLGEIVAGIVLGPTLLGAFPGELDQVVFPPDVRPYLTVIAQLGLVLFMFIVGLEVDLSLIRAHRRAASITSVCSIALPFALGALLALALYPHHRDVNGEDVPFTAFALFIGVAMSITAFPVLARLLSERGLQRTPVGVLSLACAAVDDVLAWSLLAIVVAVRIGGSLTGVVQILAMTAIFALIMLLVVRPLLTRMVPRYQRAGALTPDIFAVVLAGLLVSAWATDQIGVHAIFGAFVFGAIMPRRDASGLIREILERLEQVSLLLLLPVFFVVTGLQVNVGAVGPAGLWQLGLILLVAVGGKFLGAATAARIQRVPRRQAAAVGVLMNTRGLTELVILQVGAQLGVLDQSLFTLLVIMALVTTGMTAPLLRLVYPDRVLLREIAAAERAELSEPESYTVLVWVTDPVHDGPLVQLALDFLGREEPARLVLCQFLPQPKFKLEVASGLGAELGAIASAGDALRALARQTQSPDVTSTVVARFSADPLEDIATLAETAHANVLVTRNSNEFPTPGTWAMATADPVQHLSLGAVAVVTDGAADGRACVRLGAALAMRSGSTLTIGGGEGRGAARRASVAAAVLRRRGIPAVAADNEFLSASSVMLLPQHLASSVENLAEHPTVVRVRAGTEDIDDDLETAVARIAVPAVPTVPDYREPDGDSKTKLR